MQITLEQRRDATWRDGSREMGKKPRIYVSVDDALDIEEPTGPFCVDTSCQSHLCKQARDYRVLLALGYSREAALISLGWEWDHLAGWDYVPTGEVDHKVWASYMRRAKRLRKLAIEEAIEKGLLPRLTGITWSAHAGCSCPCSPGFVAEGPRGATFWLKVAA
jgi:hypothetical protein